MAGVVVLRGLALAFALVLSATACGGSEPNPGATATVPTETPAGSTPTSTAPGSTATLPPATATATQPASTTTAEPTTAATETATATTAATNTPTPAPTATPWPATSVTITGRPSTWSLDNVTVGVGSTVTWTWADNIHVHNVSVPGLLSDVPVTRQGSRSLTFQQKGSYAFTCDAHPETMTGAVTVR